MPSAKRARPDDLPPPPKHSATAPGGASFLLARFRSGRLYRSQCRGTSLPQQTPRGSRQRRYLATDNPVLRLEPTIEPVGLAPNQHGTDVQEPAKSVSAEPVSPPGLPSQV